jgi:hypothetical protein
MSILIDPGISCDELRRKLYGGDIILLTRLRNAAIFASYARRELTALFRPHDPEHAHEHISPADMAAMLGEWKPRFIHAQKSRELVRAIITEARQAAGTYFNVPKPRTSFPEGHLASGVAFAFPWHRDTWYSAPRQQLNWWLPIFPVREDNAMKFDLDGFGRHVLNDSDTFDYYRHNASRAGLAAQVTSETAARPRALDYRPRREVTILPVPGQVMLFSGDHLHATIPNTSSVARFSADFRTINMPDVLAGRGAPVPDAHCTGTAIRDFISVATEAVLDEEIVVKLFGVPPPGAMLVFGAPEAR